MIDYGPGDMVASIYANHPETIGPKRPVMVCSLSAVHPTWMCGTHPDGKDCSRLAVRFVDFPEPGFGLWCACAFRKVIEPGAEMDQKVRESEPA